MDYPLPLPPSPWQHFMNHSSNLIFHCAGRGSEEAGMIKSVFSVFENNIVAHCCLGHLFNAQPYIEPAAGESTRLLEDEDVLGALKCHCPLK